MKTMRALLLIIAVFNVISSSAQMAIVRDKDGFVYVRAKPETGKNILDSIRNGQMVYCLEPEGNWLEIDYERNGDERNGYIYSDRVQLISDYETIPQSEQQVYNAAYTKGNIRVSISTKFFDPMQYQLSYFKKAKDQIEFINGKAYWGTDGYLPRTAYRSLSVYYGGRKLIIPPGAWADLFEPDLSATKVNYDKAGDILYIQSMNGDAAGSYVVIWKIVKGVYRGRYVAYGF